MQPRPLSSSKLTRIASPDPGIPAPPFTTTAPASQNGTEEVRSAPDLSTWGLMAMVLGIWFMVGIDARRRAARR